MEKNEAKIGVGSVVALKSGGPSMVVTEVKDTEITARWFLEGSGFQLDTFHAVTLTPSSGDKAHAMSPGYEPVDNKGKAKK